MSQLIFKSFFLASLTILSPMSFAENEALDAARKSDWIQFTRADKSQHLKSALGVIQKLKQSVYANKRGDIVTFTLEADAIGTGNLRKHLFQKSAAIYLPNESAPYSHTTGSSETHDKVTGNKRFEDGAQIQFHETKDQQDYYYSPVWSTENSVLLQISPADPADGPEVRRFLHVQIRDGEPQTVVTNLLRVNQKTGEVTSYGSDTLEESEVSRSNLQHHAHRPENMGPPKLSAWNPLQVSKESIFKIPVPFSFWQMSGTHPAHKKAIAALAANLENYKIDSRKIDSAARELVKLRPQLEQLSKEVSPFTIARTKAESELSGLQSIQNVVKSRYETYLEKLERYKQEVEAKQAAIEAYKKEEADFTKNTLPELKKEVGDEKAKRDAHYTENKEETIKVISALAANLKYLIDHKEDFDQSYPSPVSLAYDLQRELKFLGYDDKALNKMSVDEFFNMVKGKSFLFSKLEKVKKDPSFESTIDKKIENLSAQKEKVSAETPYITLSTSRATLRKTNLQKIKDLESEIQRLSDLRLSLSSHGSQLEILRLSDDIFSYTEQRIAREVEPHSQANRKLKLNRLAEEKASEEHDVKELIANRPPTEAEFQEQLALAKKTAKKAIALHEPKHKQLEELTEKVTLLERAGNNGPGLVTWNGNLALATIAAAATTENSPSARQYFVELRDPSTLRRLDHLLVTIDEPAEKNLPASVTLLAIGDKEKAKKIADLKLFENFWDKNDPKASFADYLRPLHEFHGTLDVKNLTDMKSFPEIKRSLERQGLLPKNLKLEDVRVVHVPQYFDRDNEAKDTMAFVAGKGQTPQAVLTGILPAERQDGFIKRFIGDKTIYSSLPLDVLDRTASDVVFHETVHLADQADTLSAAPATAPTFQEEMPTLIERARKTQNYQDRWQEFRDKQELDLRLSDASPQAKQKVRDAFEEKYFGKDFKRTQYLWQRDFNYLTNPMETLAWKAQVSFLKHEKAMSLKQVLSHMARLSGATENAEFSTLLTEKVTRWYEEN